MNFSTETSNSSASRLATALLIGRCPFSMLEIFWRVKAPSLAPSSAWDRSWSSRQARMFSPGIIVGFMERYQSLSMISISMGRSHDYLHYTPLLQMPAGGLAGMRPRSFVTIRHDSDLVRRLERRLDQAAWRSGRT